MRLSTLTLLVLAGLGLSGCANTLEGIHKDTERAGDKAQIISQTLIAP